MAVALRLEHRAAFHLQDNPDFGTLQQIPGTGPILVLTIPADAGDLRPFGHHHFLKFCGLDLSTPPGPVPRYNQIFQVLQRATTLRLLVARHYRRAADREQFRDKFERYLRRNPVSADRKRMAYAAVAARMARVTYRIIESEPTTAASMKRPH